MSNPYDCGFCHNDGFGHAEDCQFHPDNLRKYVLSELETELERINTSNAALLAERNTWARQMADLRDERDTACDQADEWRSRWNEAENERTSLEVKLEDAQAAALRDAARAYPTMLRDMVSRGSVVEWLNKRADQIVEGE